MLLWAKRRGCFVRFHVSTGHVQPTGPRPARPVTHSSIILPHNRRPTWCKASTPPLPPCPTIWSSSQTTLKRWPPTSGKGAAAWVGPAGGAWSGCCHSKGGAWDASGTSGAATAEARTRATSPHQPECALPMLAACWRQPFRMSASTPSFLGRQSLHAFTLRRLCLLLLRSMLEAALSHERFHPVYLAAKQYACCDALNWLGGLWLGEQTATVGLGRPCSRECRGCACGSHTRRAVRPGGQWFGEWAQERIRLRVS